MLLGVVDTAVVGRLGGLQLGAVGLGNAVFFGFTVTGIGIMLGVDPLITQALGAREPAVARQSMWQGIWLAVGISLPMVVLASWAASSLNSFGIDPATANEAAAYVDARLWALPTYLIYAATRCYLQALGRTGPLVVGTIIANVLNLPLNWLLVLGDGGLLRLGLEPLGFVGFGVAGAGYVSAACTAVQLAINAVAVRKVPIDHPERLRLPARGPLSKAVRLGVPLGLQRLAEVGVFSLSGILMGKIGSQAIASHQIAMTLASTTFMVPLGISSAAAVRVGRAVGREDSPGVRRAGYASLLCAVVFMGSCALALWLFPELLAAVFTDDSAVIAAARPLLLIAAGFQIADGLQVVAGGALRGMGETRVPLYFNLVGHYAIGMPLGVVLAFVAEWRGPGLWWGMFTGLTVVAVTLCHRFKRLSARPVARV